MSSFKKGNSPFGGDKQSVVDNSWLQTDSTLFGMPASEAEERGIVPLGNGSFVYKRFTLAATGLSCPTDMTREEWDDVGHVLRSMERRMGWIVGDWFNAGVKQKYGDLKRLAELFGYEHQTVRAYVSVCRKVLIRNQHLDLAHHRLVTRMEPNEQRKWLDRAARKNWTVAEMRQAITGEPTPLSPRFDTDTVKAFTQTSRKLTKYVSGAGGFTDDEVRAAIDAQRAWLDDLERTLR